MRYNKEKQKEYNIQRQMEHNIVRQKYNIQRELEYKMYSDRLSIQQRQYIICILYFCLTMLRSICLCMLYSVCFSLLYRIYPCLLYCMCNCILYLTCPGMTNVHSDRVCSCILFFFKPLLLYFPWLPYVKLHLLTNFDVYFVSLWILILYAIFTFSVQIM